jgi:hypothetical protein
MRRPIRLTSHKALMADVRDGVGPYLSVFLKGGLHGNRVKSGLTCQTKAASTKTHNDRTEVRTVG